LKQYWGISAHDILWYEKALRHKSVVGLGQYDHVDCNERLELLGDAVLDTVITEYLFKRFPESNEGYLTKLRARIVNRQTLGTVGKSAGLHEVIEARIGSDDSMEKIVGNALEAWLGAIYVDRGFRAAKRSIERFLIERYINLEHIEEQSFDFKSKLIEWAQQDKRSIRFVTVNDEHDLQSFVCEIFVEDKPLANGKERSKKKAEQVASKMACESLNL
jgi:ribonuclease-3